MTFCHVIDKQDNYHCYHMPNKIAISPFVSSTKIGLILEENLVFLLMSAVLQLILTDAHKRTRELINGYLVRMEIELIAPYVKIMK